MMKVISHRGYWKTAAEKNTYLAFTRSFAMGFGTETDVRDLNEKLVISHDMPNDSVQPMDAYLRDLARFDFIGALPQAINIKSDGLAQELAKAMKTCRHPWFVFDMSVPDMIQHIRAGNPTFARMSEYEDFPVKLQDQIKGIWLDAFHSTWYSVDVIESMLKNGLQVCVVSPELHGRADHEDLWRSLRSVSTYDGLILCTDLPESASSALALPGF